MPRPLDQPPKAVFVLLGFALAACGLTQADEPTQQPPSEQATVLPAAAQPRLGERLDFHGRWMGIPVGYGWIEVKGIVLLNGRRAIHIEAQGHTNDVLSTFYPIHDIVHSYLDAETLQPLQFEKSQREGHYRADEIVMFDHEHALATYHSRLNGSVKTINLPDAFQDLISTFYWFRSQPLRSGASLELNIYSDEKIYATEIQVSQPTMLELLKRGTFPCLVVEPKASFKGLLVKRGRIWAYLSADEHRLPLLVKATTPWGAMSAVIDQDSIPPTLRRARRHSRAAR